MTLLDLLPFCLHPQGKRKRRKKKRPPSKKQRVPVLRNRLWNEDPHCFYCRRRIRKSKGTVDHIVPKSCLTRGRNRRGNLVLCCPACNQAKGNMTLREWATKIAQAYVRTVRESGVSS